MNGPPDPLEVIKGQVGEIKGRVDDIDTAIWGNERQGYKGIRANQEALHDKQEKLEDLLQSLAAKESRREEDETERERKRDFYNRTIFGLLVTIFSGVLIQVILFYFGSGFGPGG